MTITRCSFALAFVTFMLAGCTDSAGSGAGDTRAPDPSPKSDKDAPKPDERPRACTEMACDDQATITTKLTAAGAPLGAHEFAVDIDGVAQTCTVEFKEIDETMSATCSGDASLNLGPAMRGVETRMGDMVGYTEEPIAGEFVWRLALVGTPKSVKVVHTHAGKTLVDQTATFSYADHRPNGEGCEPVCKTASVDWVGP